MATVHRYEFATDTFGVGKISFLVGSNICMFEWAVPVAKQRLYNNNNNF
jgi:hypothetical protein